MSTHSRVRQLSQDMSVLQAEVAEVHRMLDSVCEAVARAAEEHGRPHDAEAPAADKERNLAEVLDRLPQRWAETSERIRDEVGMVRTSLQRSDSERAAREQAVEGAAAEQARTLTEGLTALAVQVRAEFGRLGETLHRLQEERAAGDQTLDARAAALGQTLLDALHVQQQKWCEATDGLREEFMQYTDGERAVRERMEAHAAEREQTLAGAVAALTERLTEATAKLSEGFGLIRESLQQADAERLVRDRATETNAAERDRLLVATSAAVTGRLDELLEIIRDRVGVIAQSLAATQPTQPAASEGRDAGRLPGSTASVTSAPAGASPIVSARSTTTYYFQLDKGESVPDLDAVTVPYVTERMSSRREERGVEP